MGRGLTLPALPARLVAMRTYEIVTTYGLVSGTRAYSDTQARQQAEALFGAENVDSIRLV